MIIRLRTLSGPDRIRLIAIETMKGAFGNEGALRFLRLKEDRFPRRDTSKNIIFRHSEKCSGVNKKGRMATVGKYEANCTDSVVSDGDQ